MLTVLMLIPNSGAAARRERIVLVDLVRLYAE
jgi:hypothetical protein